MPSGVLCDICKTRPATTEVTVLENGRRKVLHICTQDLRKLQQQSASPFDRMFGGSLFDNFFQDSDAKEILSGRIGTGDVVRVNFDKSSGKMTFVKQ